MKKNELVTAILGPLSKRFDVAERPYDGLFNVWKKVADFNKDGTFDIYWQVIHVANTKAEAVTHLNKTLGN